VTKRTISNAEEKILEKAAKYLPGGSNGNTITQDIVIRNGKGSLVWDISGNEFIDYSLGSGPMLIGHAHPEIISAISEQISKGSTFFGLNEHAIELAEKIVQTVPCAEKVRFASTGSEATFHALRAARAYTQKQKILKFEGGYHGMSDYALMSMAPSKSINYPQAAPDSPGIPDSIQSEVLIAPFNDLESTTNLIRQHQNELAAVITEPFQRVIAPIPGFLEGLRTITTEYEIPLIFDEVVTGFRFALGGAQEYYGVTPDLAAFGKAMAGGFPLTAVVGKTEIMDYFDSESGSVTNGVLQEGTLNGNPIAALAGLTAINILSRENVYENLFAIGNKIKVSLQDMLDQAEIPANVIGEAPVFDVYFTSNDIFDYRSSQKADKDKHAKFTSLLLERGIYKNHNKFYVSIAHSQKDVDNTLNAFQSAIELM